MFADIMKESEIITEDIENAAKAYPESWIGVMGVKRGTDVVMDMCVVREPSTTLDNIPNDVY